MECYGVSGRKFAAHHTPHTKHGWVSLGSVGSGKSLRKLGPPRLRGDVQIYDCLPILKLHDLVGPKVLEGDSSHFYIFLPPCFHIS